MARIAVGGFHHETNTFAPTKASFELFERADGWPALGRGQALLDNARGVNLSITGFAEAAAACGHDLAPLVWCNASPSAHVTEDAYERVAAMMLEDLAAAGPVDAVYLDLHGAMVTEHLQDGEGELLRRVRDLVGPGLPVVASLDLHANVTPEMVAHADALVAYRSYPHVDMAETGVRAAGLLWALLDGRACCKAYRQAPFLIPLNWQCTLIEPAKGIYARLAALEEADAGILGLSFTPGFPPADIHHCGPAVMAYADSQRAADVAADALATDLLAHEADFAGHLYQPDEAVRVAVGIARSARRPVVIADTQDNPGAGGNGDTTGMLAALLRNDPERAVLGLLCDADVAAQAHAAGQGAIIETGLGAKSGLPGHASVHARYEVERLGNGRFTATGPFYGGSHMDLGPMALLRIVDTDIRVVVCSRKVQAADQAMFRHLGVEPADTRILVLKSSVHFRADFGPIAEDILIAVAPGPNPADPADLPFRNLREGMRLSPNGPRFHRR